MPLVVRLVLYFVPMVLSLTVHECAHALSAHWLGDDTAKERGRLTLNPLPHIDPIGTLLLPAILVASGGGIRRRLTRLASVERSACASASR
jgi:Zn-dependent protease